LLEHLTMFQGSRRAIHRVRMGDRVARCALERQGGRRGCMVPVAAV